MAYEEVSGGNSGEREEREFVSPTIGAEFEGTYRDIGPLYDGKFSQYRVVSFDAPDGRKLAVRASKILLERIEAAGLSDGDGLKVTIESAKTKDGSKTYALPRVYVDRKGGQPAAPAAEPAPKAAPAFDDDNPPF